MTQPHPPGDDRIVDFTIPMEPIRFRVGPHDDDVFAAPAIIAPVTLQRVAAARASFNTAMQDAAGGGGDDSAVIAALTKIADLFKTLLPGSEGERFSNRLFDDERPLDLNRQVLPIMHHLLERYGLRPTMPSPDSPNGSPTPSGDTPSTDGASAEASTSTN